MLHVKRGFVLQTNDLALANSQKRGNFSQKRGNFSQKRGNFFSATWNYSPFLPSIMSKRRREAGLPVWLKLTGLAVYSSFEVPSMGKCRVEGEN